MTEARRAVERAARDSYGRLIAFLAARSRDVAAAEDALADAFRSALEAWPQSGVPDRPEAWLLVAARRRLTDGHRRSRVAAEAESTLRALAGEAHDLTSAGAAFPDERLKLLFVCAHPAIDAGTHTPLMLQVVLGIDATRIAAAFLSKASAVGQRLSRAKAKIRDAGIAFEAPRAGDLPARLGAVLEAIYTAFGSSWDDPAGADPRRRGLAQEAIDLGRLLVGLMPAEPEPKGLLALMLHCESRRAARRDAGGAYVPLSAQDTTQWSVPLIAEAEALLAEAAPLGRVGRFQLEAAIQSAHAGRLGNTHPDWEAVALLYEGLVRLSPTTGALVGRAAAIAEARGPAAGWALLDAIPDRTVESYQPYWALSAHLLTALGRSADAGAAFDRAIGLCADPAVRAFLVELQCKGLNGQHRPASPRPQKGEAKLPTFGVDPAGPCG